jgi:hypothetical protein
LISLIGVPGLNPLPPNLTIIILGYSLLFSLIINDLIKSSLRKARLNLLYKSFTLKLPHPFALREKPYIFETFPSFSYDHNGVRCEYFWLDKGL